MLGNLCLLLGVIAVAVVVVRLLIGPNATDLSGEILDRARRGEPDVFAPLKRARGDQRRREALILAEQSLRFEEFGALAKEAGRLARSLERPRRGPSWLKQPAKGAEGAPKPVSSAPPPSFGWPKGATPKGPRALPPMGAPTPDYVQERRRAWALMLESAPALQEERLRTVDEDKALAQGLLSWAPGSPLGLCVRGAAALREGKIAEALRDFEEAQGKDPRSYPAALGVIAARRLQVTGAWEAVRQLPEVEIHPGWNSVLPDLGALTVEERRVVGLSLLPLRALLPELFSRGATLRILPLTCQITASQGADSAVEGSRTGLCKVEDVLDVSSGIGWMFAFHLARLAEGALPPPWRRRVRGALLEVTREAPWTLPRDMRDAGDFLGLSYVGWLTARLSPTNSHARHFQRGYAPMEAFFDELLARDSLDDGFN